MIVLMSSKKKCTKQYKGSNAAARPSVTKVSAVKRAPLHQWWVDHQRMVRIWAIAAAVAFVVIVVVVGIIDIIW